MTCTTSDPIRIPITPVASSSTCRAPFHRGTSPPSRPRSRAAARACTTTKRGRPMLDFKAPSSSGDNACRHPFLPMQSIDLIRDNLTRSRDRVLAHIDEMRDHAVVFPTPQGGCHTLWVLGHLAYIEALVVCTFMRGDPNPLADWQHV